MYLLINIFEENWHVHSFRPFSLPQNYIFLNKRIPWQWKDSLHEIGFTLSVVQNIIVLFLVIIKYHSKHKSSKSRRSMF